MVALTYILVFSLVFIGVVTNAAALVFHTSYNVGTLIVDLCYLALAASFARSGRWRNAEEIRRLKIPLAFFLVYAGWCAYLSITGANPLYERIMGFRNNVVYPGIWILFAFGVPELPIRKVLDFLWFSGIFVCLYALEQAIFFIDMPDIMLWLHGKAEVFEFHGWETIIFRVNGLVGNPLVFAGFSAFVLIVGWVRLEWDRRWWNRVLLVVPAVAAYLTYTRSVLVALPVSIGAAYLLFGSMSRLRRWSLVVCGILGIAFLVLGGRFGPACIRNQFIFQRMAGTEVTTRASNETRFQMMKGGVSAIRQHPWRGLGNGSQGYSVKDHTGTYGGDGSLFALLLETGAVGFALAMAFLLACVKRLVDILRHTSRDDPHNALSRMLLTGGLFFFLMCLLNSAFTCRTNLCLYFLFLGTAFSCSGEASGTAAKILPLFDPTAIPRVIVRNWDLIVQMTQRSLGQRYRGSTLGLVWSFVQPLMMLCVYTFVFSVVFKSRWGVDVSVGDSKGAFAVIMFCGMAMFNLFSEAISMSCGSVVGNPNLVKKVIFPLEVLPLTQVATTFILGMAWFVLLFFGAWLILGRLSWTMLLLPIVMIPHVVFTTGISYLVASLGVYVRDTQYVIGVVLQILFFATPIFYPVNAVPEKFRVILELNPLTVFIEQARNVFLYGRMPNWLFLGLATLVSLIVLQLGYYFFFKTKRGFADVL